jgi:hypothetical protein
MYFRGKPQNGGGKQCFFEKHENPHNNRQKGSKFNPGTPPKPPQNPSISAGGFGVFHCTLWILGQKRRFFVFLGVFAISGCIFEKKGQK